jgi:hypothetical protein
MGIRDWFRRFASKVRDILGMDNPYDSFRCDAYFLDGGVMTFTGKPWGEAFRNFNTYVAHNAYYVTMNMQGSFWKFS